MTRLRWLASILAVLGLLALTASACAGDTKDGAVHILTTDGTVGPIMERYLARGIDRAEDNEAKLIVIQLDTPGGLDSSMREIVKDIQRSNVPIAVYVSPSGGRAASAGTFITMAAHVAAMAPVTNIGAASAINSDGSNIDGTLGRKIENDAVAFIRGIAEARGRNADWAEDAVRDAVAVGANEAVELNVVDFVATDLDDLLARSDGRTITLRPGTTVQLQGLTTAPRVKTDMTVWEHILEFLADPTLASLMISLGFLALIFELSNPGLILPGVAGLIAITLGFLGFGVLPVETAGLVLIGIALLLFALELFVPSGGILGAGGGVALLLGAIIAFRDTPAEFRPPLWLMITLGVMLGAIFASVAVGVARMRKLGPGADANTLVGKTAIVRTPLTPEGYVFIQGERWHAEMQTGKADIGDRVKIIGASGLHLDVVHEEGDTQ
jgi:membrane-bound serine protease (ClpP class)